ncbi:MAG TPA: secretin N-terminal domain-containing protein [Pantanalinema sp.]
MHHLLLLLLACLLFAQPAFALNPSEVFSVNGKAGLLDVRFDDEQNALVIQGDGALHFQLEERLSQTPPSLTVRLFNATPRKGFNVLKEPVGPIERMQQEVLPAANGSPQETRLQIVLKGSYRPHSVLSPDTKRAVIRFDRTPVSVLAELPKGIVVRHLEYANARDIANVLATMLPQGNGRISGDEARNNLVIDNSTGDYSGLESTIQALDRPSRQVLLEAQVVEINQATARNLGFSFSPSLSANFQEKAPDNGGFGTQPIPMQPFVRTGVNMQLTLNALQNSGQAKILASPRVAALEGEESKIVTGERIPYFVTQVSGTQVFQIKEDFLAGVELRITPRVNEVRFVTSKLQTNVSTITGTTPQGYPQLSTRESQASIRVAAGQTIVIGGLLQERDIELLSGLPYLSDLPVLGTLFRSRQKDRVKTELVIFITPHILGDQ